MSKVNRSYEKRMTSAYREFVDGRDEAYPFAQILYNEKKLFGRQCEVHHIHGRGARPQYHWWCNLICIGWLFHKWGTDACPSVMEIVSLRAKMEAERVRRADSLPEAEPERRIWYPKVMAENVGYRCLSARVEILMEKETISGTPYEKMGLEILKFLDR